MIRSFSTQQLRLVEEDQGLMVSLQHERLAVQILVQILIS